jgi:hypothetical protein
MISCADRGDLSLLIVMMFDFSIGLNAFWILRGKIHTAHHRIKRVLFHGQLTVIRDFPWQFMNQAGFEFKFSRLSCLSASERSITLRE